MNILLGFTGLIIFTLVLYYFLIWLPEDKRETELADNIKLTRECRALEKKLPKAKFKEI